MADIGDLVINLTARTAKLEADLKRATGVVRRESGAMRGSMAGIQKSVTGLQTAFRVLAGSAVIGFAVRQFNEMVSAQDRAGKSALRLGIAVEQLTAIHFAAGQAGIAVNTLEMAMQRMVRRIAEARQGTGEAKGALGELGLDPAKLAALSPDRQLNAIADALRGVGSEADQVRLAFKLFDSEGVSMLQMVKGGSAELEQMKERARELGVVFDKDATQAATDFRDSLNELSASGKGVFLAMANPAVHNMATAMRSTADAVKDLRQYLDNSPNMTRFLKALAGDIATGGLIRLLPQGGTDTDALTKFALGEADRRLAAAGAGGGGGGGADYQAVAIAKQINLQLTTEEAKAVEVLFQAEMRHEGALRLNINLEEEATRIREDAAKAASEMVALTGQLQEAELRHVEALQLNVNLEAEALRIRQEQAQASAMAEANTRAFANVVSSGLVNGIMAGRNLSEVFRGMALQLASMIIQAQLFNAIMGAFKFTGNAPTGVPQANPAAGVSGASSRGGRGGGVSIQAQAVAMGADLRRRGYGV